MNSDLHHTIASIVAQTASDFPDFHAIFAPECIGTHRLPLFADARRCRESNYCWIDACIVGTPSTVTTVIEIEQSGIPAPAKLGGKLLPIALARYLDHDATGRVPLDSHVAFIQVINSENVKDASRKLMQYRKFEADVKRLLPIGSVAEYHVIPGTPAEFEGGAEPAKRLVAALQRLLTLRQGRCGFQADVYDDVQFCTKIRRRAMEQKWEYRAVSMKTNAGGSHVVEALNNEGQEGWELVQIMGEPTAARLSGVADDIVAIYKRPVD
jgi:Domain of unknown function (DUF4177)